MKDCFKKFEGWGLFNITDPDNPELHELFRFHRDAVMVAEDSKEPMALASIIVTIEQWEWDNQ